MKRFFVMYLCFIFCIVGCTTIVQQSPTEMPTLSGSWQGVLEIAPSQTFTLTFTIEDEFSSVPSTLSIVEQGVKGLPITSVSIDEDLTVSLFIEVLQATFTGSLDEKSATITGTFTQMGASFPLILERKEIEEGFRRIQDPTPPFPYISEDVFFPQSPEGFTLAGTITRPKEEGVFPAIVLVTGSGSQDRNEEIFGHKPFLIIADALTRAGYVVLRYDDRGFAQSEGDVTEATTIDFADDAESALSFLKGKPYVDQQRMGILGHSEGGIIASILAQRNADVSFIILLASSGVDGMTTVISQSEAILRAQGAPKEVIQQVVEINKSIYAIIIDDTIAQEDKERSIRQKMALFGLPKESIDAQMEMLLSPWYKTFLILDPSSYLKEVTIPVLIVQGTKDTQVVYDLHVPAIEQALEVAGNQRVTTKVYEGLNHLLQPAITGAVEEYGQIEITIEVQVLEDIVQWLHLW